MLLKSIRRMYGLRFEGQWRWAHHFLLVIWLLLLAASPPRVLGYFLGDTKAILNGCKDHWTLQDRATMPLLFQMTVCVDIRVVVPGAWVAFSYSSVHAPRPDLGLEGDDGALYGWLLRVRHRFPVRLSPTHWHRVCLRRDVPGNSFSLEVDGKMVAERTVIAQAIPPTGSLWLGCRPRDRPPGAVLGEVEVYLFRMWADLGDHGLCEDGTVIGWNAHFWGLTSPNARQRDPNLMCDHRRLKRGTRGYRSINGVLSAIPTGLGRLFSSPPYLRLPTTTPSPVIATPVTNTRDQTEFTDHRRLKRGARGYRSVNGVLSVSTSPGVTTVYSSQTEPPSVPPSTNVTLPTTLSALNPTKAPSTDSTTADWTPSNTTVPATGEKINSYPAPVSPVASHQTATTDATSPTARSTPPSTSTQTSSNTTLPDNQNTPRSSLMSASSPLNCDISKLCSNENAYFWMSVSVKAKGYNKTEQDVHNLVSKVFGCGSYRGNAMPAVKGGKDFCQGNRSAQVIEVNCGAKRNISKTNCYVLLWLTHAVSVCELQHAGNSALDRAEDKQIQAEIIGEVERVGRDLCGDMKPSSGSFVRCTSSSSPDICKANLHSNLTCSLIEPNSIPAPQPETKSCSREAPRFCDCTAFCNSSDERQFFAIRININSTAVNVSLLQKLLSGLNLSHLCNTGTESECQEYSEILKFYKSAHLECHGTQQRLYSCMVILEMSGTVSVCSLSKLMQQVFGSNSNITHERPLTRMVVCGPPDLPVRTLLASNLTWVASDLLTSDICQPDPTLLKCEANETLAVLLNDSCPPKPLTTNPSTVHPSTQTKSNITEATPPTATNATQQTNTTSENTPATQQRNASQARTQPHATTEYNIPTTDTFTPSLNYTKLHNATTANTFTPSPNDTTEYNVTTAKEFTPSPNDTTVHNATTADSFTTAPNVTTVYNVTTANTFTPSPNDTMEYNTTTAKSFTRTPNAATEHNVTTADTFTPSPNDTTVHNATTADSFTTAPNVTTVYNVTTANTFTPSPNDTMEYNTTTAKSFTLTPNAATEHNATTADSFTTAPNVTTVYNVTTANTFTLIPNHTTVHNVTTADTFTPSPNHTTMYNVTTAINSGKVHNSTNSTRNPMVSTFTTFPNHTNEYNVTTVNNNYTTEYNVTTVTNKYTTEYNVTTVNSNMNLRNSTITSNATISTFTTSPNHTIEYNVTTVNNNYTTDYNVTTVTNNYTTEYNVTTVNSNTNQRNSTITSNATISTFTTSPNHTIEYNVTTASKNYTVVYNVNTAGNNRNLHNVTITTSSLTTSPNYTMVNNETTASNSYTAAENITTTSISQNKSTSDNVTTAPIRGTQQNTTVPYKNTTTSTTAGQVNETHYNTTTSTKNSTVDNMTSVVDNTTKTTVAPLNNQTTNYTTVSVPDNSMTTNRNDSNSTTAASSFSPMSNLNTTAGTSFSLSSIASSLTTDFNITKHPRVSSTIAGNTSLEHISTTSTSTMTTTTTTVHDPLPAQDNTTTALQTTTLTSTTNTIAGNGITSTTTEETTNSQVAQDEQADALLNETQDASQLSSAQVTRLVGMLEKLLDGPTVSQTVGKKTINIVSNLMQGDSQALSASANRLIRLVDVVGLKLDVTIDSAILSSNSLVLAVRTVDGTNFPTTSVNIFNTNNVQLRGLSRSQSESSEPAMGSVFLPSSLTEGLSPEEQKHASRVQFTWFTKSAFFQDAALKNQTLVSPVLGSSVANMSISNLKENIQFTIRNINPIHSDFEASCVFWNFTLNGGGGGWSSAGCSVVNATPEDTTCSCNHLTSFAILLDLSRQGITDRQQAQILTFITYIGCGVSAIFLAITILTYLSFEKLLRDIPAKILVQLCISIFFLNLVFLLDGWLALYQSPGLCISTAFFLHYFLLTSFTWAGLEALHMYLSIVRVFTPYLSRYMLKFTLMGWGIPLIVVIVVISVDKDNYGLVTYGKYTNGTSDDFCWLRNNIAFYVGVVAYFILIFVLCLLVFIIVMVQLARIKKQNPQNQSPNRGVMTDLRSIAGLIVLLGLTWGFALFAWGPLYLPFIYLFSIFNSLQGFFVFVFHCAVKENVRRQWRTYLCCGKLRLAENSEWSRTATQNNKNLSVATATTSALHLTSRSSSVISDSTNSSAGSVFADSGISDGSNSDVVLNELHRRNLSLQGEA